MGTFNSKEFNPEAFGKVVSQIENENKSALAKSKVIGKNARIRQIMKDQAGLVYAKVNYSGRISGKTSQNNDGNTDITSSSLSSYMQGFSCVSRMDSWNELSFTKNVTDVDFMDFVASQIADYHKEVEQEIALCILKGIFSQKITGSSAKEKAAKEFVERHTYDVTGLGEGMVDQTTLNTAANRACGDNKSIFKLVIMHSDIATNLENINLLKHLIYTDANGIQRELGIASWNGKEVLIDDGVPIETVEEGEGDPKTTYTKYTTYALGEGAINIDNIGDSVPYEIDRDPRTKGGMDLLYVRDRYIIGAEGMSMLQPSGVSLTNEEISSGTSWEIINDGNNFLNHKLIPIARIFSRG